MRWRAAADAATDRLYQNRHTCKCMCDGGEWECGRCYRCHQPVDCAYVTRAGEFEATLDRAADQIAARRDVARDGSQPGWRVRALTLLERLIRGERGA